MGNSLPLPLALHLAEEKEDRSDEGEYGWRYGEEVARGEVDKRVWRVESIVEVEREVDEEEEEDGGWSSGFMLPK